MKKLFENYSLFSTICCIIILALITLLAQHILGENNNLVIFGVGVFTFVAFLIFNPFNIFGKNG